MIDLLSYLFCTTPNWAPLPLVLLGAFAVFREKRFLAAALGIFGLADFAPKAHPTATPGRARAIFTRPSVRWLINGFGCLAVVYGVAVGFHHHFKGQHLSPSWLVSSITGDRVDRVWDIEATSGEALILGTYFSPNMASKAFPQYGVFSATAGGIERKASSLSDGQPRMARQILARGAEDVWVVGKTKIDGIPGDKTFIQQVIPSGQNRSPAEPANVSDQRALASLQDGNLVLAYAQRVDSDTDITIITQSTGGKIPLLKKRVVGLYRLTAMTRTGPGTNFTIVGQSLESVKKAVILHATPQGLRKFLLPATPTDGYLESEATAVAFQASSGLIFVGVDTRKRDGRICEVFGVELSSGRISERHAFTRGAGARISSLQLSLMTDTLLIAAYRRVDARWQLVFGQIQQGGHLDKRLWEFPASFQPQASEFVNKDRLLVAGRNINHGTLVAGEFNTKAPQCEAVRSPYKSDP